MNTSKLRRHPSIGLSGYAVDRLVLGLFTVAIGLSAFQLFAVQPLFARLVLPTLGGTPAVWTTSLHYGASATRVGCTR